MYQPQYEPQSKDAIKKAIEAGEYHNPMFKYYCWARSRGESPYEAYVNLLINDERELSLEFNWDDIRCRLNKAARVLIAIRKRKAERTADANTLI